MHFLAATLPRVGLLNTLLLARLEIVSVLLYLFNNIFLQHSAFEALKGAFDGLTFMKPHFSHSCLPKENRRKIIAG